MVGTSPELGSPNVVVGLPSIVQFRNPDDRENRCGVSCWNDVIRQCSGCAVMADREEAEVSEQS